MSLYLLTSDLHLADRAPSSCQDGYLDDLFGLLEQTVKVAGERKVAAVVWAGDIFHVKAPSRTSHRLVQRTIRLLSSYPCPVYIVPGNHDITSDRLDSIHQTQPLGVLFESGAAQRLEGWAEYDGPPGWLPIYGVPWIQGYGEYAEGCEAAFGVNQELLSWHMSPGPVRYGLVVAHAPLYPPGRESPYEYFPAEKWAEEMGGAGSVFYGHVHPWHGVYESGGVTFCNHGALSRGSLHESELTRQVGCTLWDSETGEFEFVPLDAKPASEVFRLTERQQVTDMAGRLDDFLSSVGGTTLEAVSVEAVIAHIRTLGIGRDAEDLATELLTEASHGS